jgi:amidase
MSAKPKYSVQESCAFTEVFELKPTASGPLNNLRFAVKDIIDIHGRKTTCGNPSCAKTRPIAAANAVCVDQLLNAGATCAGKTITDELAFSLDGENFFFGTPLNPKAPERVPGGSSSGSASAVACGIVDFALGTDTGGSIRIPANNCGIYGMRPSHGIISGAGINPFASTFDTVGILASTAQVLLDVASVLLACVPQIREVGHIYIIEEFLDLSDSEVLIWFKEQEKLLGQVFPSNLQKISLKSIDLDPEMTTTSNWLDTYSTIQWAEIWSTLGSWIEAEKPKFGPRTEVNFELTKNLDRKTISQAIYKREHSYRKLKSFLKPNDLIVIPTAPIIAPLKGVLGLNRSEDNYYEKTLSSTSLAGIGRLPQISLPIGMIDNIPHGLSFIGASGEDGYLLSIVQKMAEIFGNSLFEKQL